MVKRSCRSKRCIKEEKIEAEAREARSVLWFDVVVEEAVELGKVGDNRILQFAIP